MKPKEPQGRYIGRGPETEKLYKLEEMILELIDSHAVEWMRVNGYTLEDGGLEHLKDDPDFWSVAVPESILMILQSFGQKYSLAACQAFFKKCEVEGKDE